MSAASTISIRDKRILTTAEVIALISEQTLKDARAAGWIRPVAVKQGKANRPIYSAADVRAVEDRILCGEYPQPKEGRAP